MADLIPTQLVDAVLDICAGYLTVSEIEFQFTMMGVTPGEPAVAFSSIRRTTLMSFLASLDIARSRLDANRFLKFTEYAIGELERSNAQRGNPSSRDLDNVRAILRNYGFQQEDSGKLLLPGTSPVVAQGLGFEPDDRQALAASSVLDEHLERIWHHLGHEHYDASIAAAKELIESVARLVLVQTGDPEAEAVMDMPKLTKRACRQIGIDTRKVKSASKDEQVDGASTTVSKGLVSLVQALYDIGEGTAQLRNRAGRGHGRSHRSAAKRRHAELAVGAAVTWCRFIDASLAAHLLRTGEDSNPDK